MPFSHEPDRQEEERKSERENIRTAKVFVALIMTAVFLSICITFFTLFLPEFCRSSGIC